MATGSVSAKVGKILDLTQTAVTIGTATGANQSASVAFTSTTYPTGGPTLSYVATSNPGSITGEASTSPITVSGLTNGTAYTFTVIAKNPSGNSIAGLSAASNSVTPYNPVIPALGAWSTAGTTSPGAAGDSYYGWNMVDGSPKVFAFAGSRNTNNYSNNGRGGTWTQNANRPTGQGLGSSSKSRTNSDRFYTYGGDTGTQTLVYSTADGSSWRQETSVSYNAGWSDGCYITNGGNHYLYAANEYPTGNTAARCTINNDGTLSSWTNIQNYPVYASAPRAARLTSIGIWMGGFTSTSLGGTRNNVYSMNPATGNWTSETAIPFTPSGGYVSAFSITGSVDSKVYVANGTSLWSRGDSSGTWTSETSTPGSWSHGWGTVDANGIRYVQVTSTSATYFQSLG